MPFQAEIDAALEPPEEMSEKEQKLLESYTLLFRKVSGVWEKNKVTPQDVEVGSKFDVDSHRKVGEREAEGDEVPGTIVEVVNTGWSLEGKLLIPSEVTIVAFPKEEEEEEGQEPEKEEEGEEEDAEEGGEDEEEAVKTEEEVKA